MRWIDWLNRDSMGFDCQRMKIGGRTIRKRNWFDEQMVISPWKSGMFELTDYQKWWKNWDSTNQNGEKWPWQQGVTELVGIFRGNRVFCSQIRRCPNQRVFHMLDSDGEILVRWFLYVVTSADTPFFWSPHLGPKLEPKYKTNSCEMEQVSAA